MQPSDAPEIVRLETLDIELSRSLAEDHASYGDSDVYAAFYPRHQSPWYVSITAERPCGTRVNYTASAPTLEEAARIVDEAISRDDYVAVVNALRPPCGSGGEVA